MEIIELNAATASKKKNSGPTTWPTKPSCAKASVIVSNTKALPPSGWKPKPKAKGKIARPASNATLVSAVTTTAEALETFWFDGI